MVDGRTTREIDGVLCYRHHTAARAGYVSRKIDETDPTPYDGRYGTGWTVQRPRYDTTRYHWLDYWLAKD